MNSLYLCFSNSSKCHRISRLSCSSQPPPLWTTSTSELRGFCSFEYIGKNKRLIYTLPQKNWQERKKNGTHTPKKVVLQYKDKFCKGCFLSLAEPKFNLCFDFLFSRLISEWLTMFFFLSYRWENYLQNWPRNWHAYHLYWKHAN